MEKCVDDVFVPVGANGFPHAPQELGETDDIHNWVV